VDYGSERPAEGHATQSHAHARLLHHRRQAGTASYFVLVQPTESLDPFAVVRSGNWLPGAGVSPNVSRTDGQSPSLHPQLMTARMEVDLSAPFSGGRAERVWIKNAPAACGT